MTRVRPSLASLRKEQERLAHRVILQDAFSRKELSEVGGGDVTFFPGRDGRPWGAAAITRYSFPDLVPQETALSEGPVAFPYIPGYLAYREIPLLLEAIARLKLRPSVFLLDGQGIAHPRGAGLATHLGVKLDVVAIGCAKTRLVGEHQAVGKDRGAFSLLQYQGRVVGAVVRTRRGVKPVYVSPGHRISLPSAIQIVLDCAPRFRIPEPLRQAHLHLVAHRREILGSRVASSAQRA